MTINIQVPGLPESVSDATVGEWHKKPGDFVARGENIVDLETDKVVLEVPAPKDGVLKSIVAEEGATVVADEVLGTFEEGAKGDSAPAAKEETKAEAAPAAEKAEPAKGADDHSPAVRRALNEKGIDASQVTGTGKGGRLTVQDVENAAKGGAKPAAAEPVIAAGARQEKRVPMNRLRKRIAERLMDAKNGTAMLTTFNEVDMSAVMNLRKQYKDSFEKRHDVRLGFMSFFTKAAVEALKRFPDVNASIDGDDLVYHGFFDIGMAVSTDRGLLVPILREPDQLGMADIEKGIGNFAKKARNGQLTIDEMTGGTFTITNGGVFGSLLSTPILNPPQSAILGLHKIEERAVVVNGEIVIRPMMYLALSYDHRIIDGKQSVQFLKTIKELIEDPSRLLLDV
jgi:2-oxoglutarate dehydrogenase E2 component (dihydrolipoamide succinyltransferase)